MRNFLLDSDGDITNEIGDATSRAIALLIESVKGERKAHPASGVNLLGLLNSSNSNVFFEIEKRIRLELEADGANVGKVEVVGESILVEASWGNTREQVRRQDNIIALKQPIEVVAQKNQTLFDIAIQYMGSDMLVVELAQENSLSLTDALLPGQVIKIHKVVNQLMVDYLKNKGVTPVSI